MTFIMTSKLLRRGKLYTDKELDLDRVFEIRIRDLRERNGNKQKSFSILAHKGLKDEEFIPLEDLKNFLEDKIKELKYAQ